MEQTESNLHVLSKMSLRDRNFVYFKAHFQALLALQQVFLKFWSCRHL